MTATFRLMRLLVPFCFLLQALPAIALNPLFDTINYQASPTSKNKKKQARFFFREAHQLDVTAVKSLHFKGDTEGAMKVLTRAKSLYRVAQKLEPTNPMIIIYYKAHDALSDGGLLIRGEADAKLALSGFYDGDGDDNETPKDPDLRAFWLGEGLTEHVEEDNDTSESSTILPVTRQASAKEEDEDKKEGSIVEKRWAALLALEVIVVPSGMEIAKSLTTHVAYHYLGAGSGAVIGFLGYVIAMKTIMCMSSNHAEAKKAKDNERLLTKLEDFLNERQHAVGAVGGASSKSAGFSLPTCSCPSCNWSWLFCGCLPCCPWNRRDMMAMPDYALEDGYVDAASNPLYCDRYTTHRNPLFDGDDSDSEPPLRSRGTLPTLNNLQDKDPERLKELTKIFKERLVKYGLDDPYVKEFAKKTKEIRKNAEQNLIIRFSPQNSQDGSVDTSIDEPDGIDALALDEQEQVRRMLISAAEHARTEERPRTTKKSRRKARRIKRRAKTHASDDDTETEEAMGTAVHTPVDSGNEADDDEKPGETRD